MNTNQNTSSTVHQGRNVKKLREGRGWKQAVLAEKAQMAQQTLSKYESMREIEEPILMVLAQALGVPVDLIKNMDTSTDKIIIENNQTFQTGSANNGGNFGVNEGEMIIHPLEQILDIFRELLQVEKDQNMALQQLIRDLKK